MASAWLIPQGDTHHRYSPIGGPVTTAAQSTDVGGRTSALVETRSIDYVPDDERHGKVSHQGPFWFVGNFQPFTLALGFVGPSLGLSLWWTIVAGLAGIAFGTLFMAFHATQGPVRGANFEQPVTVAAWTSKPSWYIVAAQDRMIDPGAQRALAKKIGATTTELPTGHVPMVSSPEAVAKVIIQAARAAAK